MRAIPLILALLAGCGPGAGSTASSFAVDSCDPKPAQIDAITLWYSSSGAPLKPNDRVTGGGGQGLPMADVKVRLSGNPGDCVAVSASVGNLHESGGLQVDPSGTIHIFMGPVDYDAFTMDIAIEGHEAHLDAKNGSVIAIR